MLATFRPTGSQAQTAKFATDGRIQEIQDYLRVHENDMDVEFAALVRSELQALKLLTETYQHRIEYHEAQKLRCS